MYSLIIEIDEFSKVEKEIYLSKYVIGRNSKMCDIVIADRFVSSRHCTLINMSPDDFHSLSYYAIIDGVLLSDIESRNGTWVNGKSVKRLTELHHQDVITFGNDRQYPRIVFNIKNNDDKEYGTGTFSAERE